MSADPYEVAGQIRRALVDIRDHYDAALIPPTRAVIRPTPERSEGQKIRAASQPYEHSPAPANIDVLAARIATHQTLVKYAQVVLHDVRNIEDGQITSKVNGSSVRSLCEFLRVWALHLAEGNPREAAAAARKLSEHGATLRAYALPDRPALTLGQCPIPSEDGNCGGVVKLRDDEGDGKCRRCGTVAVVSWWESQMGGDLDGKALVTTAELITVIARDLGMVVTHEQVWQWVSRGKIPRGGKDAKGRSLHDRALVVGLIREGKVAS